MRGGAGAEEADGEEASGTQSGASGAGAQEGAAGEEDFEIFTTSFQLRDVARAISKVVLKMVRGLKKMLVPGALRLSSQTAAKGPSVVGVARAAASEGVPLLMAVSPSRSADRRKYGHAAVELENLLTESESLRDAARNGSLALWRGSDASPGVATLVKAVVRPRRWPVLALVRCDAPGIGSSKSMPDMALLYRHSCKPPPQSEEALQDWIREGLVRGRGDAKLKAARELYLERKLLAEQQQDYAQAAKADRFAEEERRAAQLREKEEAAEREAKEAKDRERRERQKQLVLQAKKALCTTLREPADGADRSEVCRLTLRAPAKGKKGQPQRLVRRFAADAPTSAVWSWALANGITLARGEGDEPPPDADGDDDGAALLGVFLQGAGGDGKRQLEFSEERSLRESGLWPQASLVVSELGG